jgi:hypothetical protein
MEPIIPTAPTFDVNPTLPVPEDSENTKQAQEALAKLAERIANGDIAKDGIEVEGTLQEIKKATGIKKIESLRASLRKLLGTGKHAQKPETYTADEIAAAEALLKQPDLFAQFHDDFCLTGYHADKTLTTAGLLLLGYTLLPDSSGRYHYGKTASGKTQYTLLVISFFPRSRVINLTDVTPRFLYRAGGEDGKALQHCILVFGEMHPPNQQKPGDSALKQSAIRQ